MGESSEGSGRGLIHQEWGARFLDQTLVNRFTGSEINRLNVATSKNDGPDHGHQQKHRSELEGKQIVGEQMLANANGGSLTNRFRTLYPGGGENHAGKQGKQTGTDAT